MHACKASHGRCWSYLSQFANASSKLVEQILGLVSQSAVPVLLSICVIHAMCFVTMAGISKGFAQHVSKTVA